MHYDPKIAQLIVWGPDRDSAVARSRVALRELLVARGATLAD